MRMGQSGGHRRRRRHSSAPRPEPRAVAIARGPCPRRCPAHHYRHARQAPSARLRISAPSRVRPAAAVFDQHREQRRRIQDRGQPHAGSRAVPQAIRMKGGALFQHPHDDEGSPQARVARNGVPRRTTVHRDQRRHRQPHRRPASGPAGPWTAMPVRKNEPPQISDPAAAVVLQSPGVIRVEIALVTVAVMRAFLSGPVALRGLAASGIRIAAKVTSGCAAAHSAIVPAAQGIQHGLHLGCDAGRHA